MNDNCKLSLEFNVMNNLIRIWIGKRESDIVTYPYFDYSITFWGSNKNNNFSFCKSTRLNSNYSTEFTDYVIEKLRGILQDNTNTEETEIHFYNNSFAYKIIDSDYRFKLCIKNLNSNYVHNLLRHKTLSRLWLSNTVDVPAFISLSKYECTYSRLKKIYPDYKQFVIQDNYSGGGDGTFIISSNNEEKILKNLADNKVYLISPYYEDNISISCTIMVDRYSCSVFPISQQLLAISDQIRYCGNRYYYSSDNIAKEVKFEAKLVGNILRNIGYRGICGLDWIYTKGRLLLIELNPRYQGSSFAINEALKRNDVPSLFEINNYCFSSSIPTNIKESIEELSIPFENHCVFYGQKPITNSDNDILFLDGYNESNKFDKGVYLYRYISFDKNNKCYK